MLRPPSPKYEMRLIDLFAGAVEFELVAAVNSGKADSFLLRPTAQLRNAKPERCTDRNAAPR